jgi:hypothetical protein
MCCLLTIFCKAPFRQTNVPQNEPQNFLQHNKKYDLSDGDMLWMYEHDICDKFNLERFG